MQELKLYVWHETLVDYTAGVMFALASSKEEAAEVILREEGNVDSYEIYKALCSVREDPKKWKTMVKSGKVTTMILDLATEEPKIYEDPVGFAVWGGS